MEKNEIICKNCGVVVTFDPNDFDAVTTLRCPKCGADITNRIYCALLADELSKRPDVLQDFRADNPIKNIYKDYLYDLIRWKNSNDCLCFPFIPEEKLRLARKNFMIDYDDCILMIRDTSKWNDVNQGTVVTEKGIHYIVDNSVRDNIPKNRGMFKWGSIDKVQYQEQEVHVVVNGRHNIFVAKELVKGTSDCDYACCRLIAEMFDEMAHAIEAEESICDKVNRLIEAGKSEEALAMIKRLLAEKPENASYLYEGMGDVYYNLEDYNNAIKSYNNAIMHIDSSDKKWLARIRHGLLLAMIESDYDNVASMRKYAWFASQYGDDTDIVGISNDDGEGFTTKQDAEFLFRKLDDYYGEEFLKIPYNERKILMPVKEYTELDQDVVNVIRIDRVPKNINFPQGHPIVNQLYIGHPLCPEKYMPFESHQRELLVEKLREFCYFVQALGATEVRIGNLSATSGKESNDSYKTHEGKISHPNVGLEASKNNSSNQRLEEELSHYIQLHQTFTPKLNPYLPDDLIWYKDESSWQTIYKQRMSGSIDSYDEKVETRKSQMVEKKEIKKINGEVRILLTKVGGSMDTSDEETYQLSENVVLNINVKFAPINPVTGDLLPTSNEAPIIQEISTAEQEYIDELRECLADGNIGNSERRLLNKLRDKLGISEERAKELEASLQEPQLTDEEQEYLEAYKDAMEDGIVTEKERRLLDKLMKINNISEQRAREIEKLYK